MTLRGWQIRVGMLAAWLVIGLVSPAVPAVSAQVPASTATLVQQVNRRFDVLPIQHGLVLRPRTAGGAVRAIELSEGTIALDGVLVSGSELRRQLGADADLVLKLSYLDDEARRAAFGVAAAGAASPAVPGPPAAPAVPAPPTALVPPVPPVPSEPPAPPKPPRSGRHSDARIKVGGELTVEADEVVNDSVVVIGGSAHVFGHVEGDVVVIGGTAELGPSAEVERDVTVVGGRLDRDPNATIGGRVNEVGLGDLNINGRPLKLQRLPRLARTAGGGVALASTLGRFLLLSLLVCVVLLAARSYTREVGARALAEPVKAGFIGVLAQALFVPTLVIVIVGMVITIIGIPLLALIPFGLLALALLAVAGFASLAVEIGDRVLMRLGMERSSVYLTALAGIATIVAPVLAARILGLGGGVLRPLSVLLLVIGVCAEYLVWTVGFGAIVLQRFDRPVVRPASPTVPPTPPPAPAVIDVPTDEQPAGEGPNEPQV